MNTKLIPTHTNYNQSEEEIKRRKEIENKWLLIKEETIAFTREALAREARTYNKSDIWHEY